MLANHTVQKSNGLQLNDPENLNIETIISWLKILCNAKIEIK